jgi:hypothetical protein
MITLDKIKSIAQDIKLDVEWVNDSHTRHEHNGVVSGLNQLIRHLEEVDTYEKIYIEWGIEDVFSLDPTLTRDQAVEVLELAEHYHDANYGINWDTLDHYIDDVKKRENQTV